MAADTDVGMLWRRPIRCLAFSPGHFLSTLSAAFWSENHSSAMADPKIWKGGGRQFISPVLIYRKYTRRSI